jgi:hypothetical protein
LRKDHSGAPILKPRPPGAANNGAKAEPSANAAANRVVRPIISRRVDFANRSVNRATSRRWQLSPTAGCLLGANLISTLSLKRERHVQSFALTIDNYQEQMFGVLANSADS